ncbi:MAG: NAD(P)-dependent dehydrogenase (short-subunit alcohol dehydrogenase family) [Kiritimatiellia bacterium]|jgi:NAD(P)-dependent dehydrogenase (short-subunit alcohol dehydrogenase family)
MNTLDDADIIEKVQLAADLLESIAEDRGLLVPVDSELRQRLLIAAGRISRPDKFARRTFNRAARKRDKIDRRQADEALLDSSGIRTLRENPIFQTPRRLAMHAGETPPSIGQVHEARTCYVCRKEFKDIHHFYDQMCLECGDFNFAKRNQSADLTGRVALITGSRVKIGFQAAISLLRSGCHVICTTRFPKDAAKRYAAEHDVEQWGHRLEICGLDLRHTPSVEAFCQGVLSRHDRLDFVINNACQTIRRPPSFYAHLMELEQTPRHELPDDEASLLAPEVHTPGLMRTTDAGSAELSQVPLLPGDRDHGTHLFPADRLDADLQQIDLRDVNSWRLQMDEVPTIELLEVHLVNAVAPFVINARLKPLMKAVPTNDAHIVNVSAMEGQFYRTFKSDRHPHTNMAKASLNMMTRTAALDYVEHGIHMNSVDTGWVTDEDPAILAERKREMHRFHPPLDIVDGAARIVDPILHGLNTGEHVWGQFLKDYKVCDW